MTYAHMQPKLYPICKCAKAKQNTCLTHRQLKACLLVFPLPVPSLGKLQKCCWKQLGPLGTMEKQIELLCEG